MWKPTIIECHIAAAVLAEYADIRGGKLPPCKCPSGVWNVDKFIHDIFTTLAGDLELSDEIDPDPWPYLSFSYKQHCAFWHVVKDYEWNTLAEYRDIIDMVSGVFDSAQEKYESRWMEWEGRYVRKELARNLKALAERREELLKEDES